MSLETYLAQNGLRSIANTTQWRRIWSCFDAPQLTVTVKIVAQDELLQLTDTLASKKHLLRSAEREPFQLREIEYIEISWDNDTAQRLAEIKAKTIVVNDRIRVFGYIKVGIY